MRVSAGPSIMPAAVGKAVAVNLIKLRPAGAVACPGRKAKGRRGRVTAPFHFHTAPEVNRGATMERCLTTIATAPGSGTWCILRVIRWIPRTPAPVDSRALAFFRRGVLLGDGRDFTRACLSFISGATLSSSASV